MAMVLVMSFCFLRTGQTQTLGIILGERLGPLVKTFGWKSDSLAKKWDFWMLFIRKNCDAVIVI